MKKGNGTVRLEDGRNGGERGRLERGAGGRRKSGGVSWGWAGVWYPL